MCAGTNHQRPAHRRRNRFQPLNGREFTKLTLLSPGAAPQEAGQRSAFTINLGAGGISPSVNGQRGEQNNFTMDGVLNNEIFLNVWAVAPPPDAIQEFNVQSHITDAQFAISSGANINVATRSGASKAELFNAFNHTNYGIPDHVVEDTSFGQIQTTAGGGATKGRIAQFALKLQF